jgi:hypothetical protein
MSTVEALNTFTQLAPVRVVSSSNQSGTYYNGPTNNGVGSTFTYATGTLTIDSVLLKLNDYVLLSGQTAAYQNGIWQVIVAGATGVAAVLQRRGDFQCREQIHGGHFVPVAAGTVFGGSVWTVVEPLPTAIGVPITSGANNINFVTITAAGSSLYLEVANNLSDVANPATSIANIGGLPVAGGQMTGSILLDRGTATSTAGAATVNHQAGVITTEALTTAAASAYAFTLTDSRITTASIVQLQLMGGTNTTRGLELRAIPGSGTAAISIYNNNVAGTALNGTLIFGFVVI